MRFVFAICCLVACMTVVDDQADTKDLTSPGLTIHGSLATLLYEPRGTNQE